MSSNYAVYLELGEQGECMAHVPALPGCLTRAADQATALAAMPDAIRAYYAWLRRHGEDAPDPPEPITLTVAETQAGMTLFRHRGRAALFDPDNAPLTRAELDRTLQLAGYLRADLLALVRSLSAAVLNWKATAEAMSIREILRHVGNAEEWYVSRLVDPATLPPEWQDDDKLAIFPFLRMERHTVAARLRRLTADELAAVVVPTAWAHNPGEPWSARKAARRLLEHEQEHLGHIREILAHWRAHLLARLAAERGALWWSVIGLDAATLTTLPVIDEWTAKDLLAHIAAWDEFVTGRIGLILSGQEATMQWVDLDDRNAALTPAWQALTLDQAVAACQAARAAFLAALARVPDADLHRIRTLPVGRRTIRVWSQNRARHDRDHARQITRWRKAQKLPRTPGPKVVLQAALAAARAELLAAVALVPPAERATRILHDEWTLKDIVGHVADWDWEIANTLHAVALGEPPAITPEADPDAWLDAWNAEHAAARRDQAWSAIWLDSQAAHAALLDVLARLDAATLARPFPSQWNAHDTVYGWLRAALFHTRDHAGQLRLALAPPPPSRTPH